VLVLELVVLELELVVLEPDLAIDSIVSQSPIRRRSHDAMNRLIFQRGEASDDIAVHNSDSHSVPVSTIMSEWDNALIRAETHYVSTRISE
jgi:hypothetical protein